MDKNWLVASRTSFEKLVLIRMFGHTNGPLNSCEGDIFLMNSTHSAPLAKSARLKLARYLVIITDLSCVYKYRSDRSCLCNAPQIFGKKSVKEMSDPNVLAQVVNNTPTGGSIFLTMEEFGLLQHVGGITVDNNKGVDEPTPASQDPRSNPKPPGVESDNRAQSNQEEVEPNFNSDIETFLQSAPPDEIQRVRRIMRAANAKRPQEKEGGDNRESKSTFVRKSQGDRENRDPPQQVYPFMEQVDPRVYHGNTERGKHRNESNHSKEKRRKIEEKCARSTTTQATSFSDSDTEDEEEVKASRPREESWPHPLAKLIGQEGSKSRVLETLSDNREMITHNRDVVREKTRNLKKTCFPTFRVGWHNGLLSLQMTQIMEILSASDLNLSLGDSRQRILNLETLDGVSVVDVQRASNWIKEARLEHKKLKALVKECLEATNHECQIARVVEKEGFSTVSAFEGTAEFDVDFKKHLDYIKKESKKAESDSKNRGNTNKVSRGKVSHFRYKGLRTRLMLSLRRLPFPISLEASVQTCVLVLPRNPAHQPSIRALIVKLQTIGLALAPTNEMA